MQKERSKYLYTVGRPSRATTIGFVEPGIYCIIRYQVLLPVDLPVPRDGWSLCE